MTLLARDMPGEIANFMYKLFCVITTVSIVSAGAPFAAVMVPVIVIMVFLVQWIYLRTSRQMRILDLEAKTPLYTKMGETLAGVEHIRSYGWSSKFVSDSLDMLDHSQKSFYYMLSIQRWLMTLLDAAGAGMVAVVVGFAVGFSGKPGQANLGLALVNAIAFSTLIRGLVTTWTQMETSLGAVARLRRFAETTPLEKDDDTCPPPQGWPSKGTVRFEHVTAKYT